jgi:hypothetical protein
VSPSIEIQPGETRVLGEIAGPGAIQQFWLTTANLRWRDLSWNRFSQVTSLAVCVNPGRAFNCYWEMPFRKSARVTIENRDPENAGIIYYQINYTLTEVPDDAAYFHAQFRRTDPLPFKEDYTILDGVIGKGHYVRHVHGLGGQQRRLVGRGRDQVLHGRRRAVPDRLRHRHRGLFLRRLQLRWAMVDSTMTTRYNEFTTPYTGLPQVIRPDGTYASQQRFGLYRWHITDRSASSPTCA